MTHSLSPQSCFDMIFDPALALAAAKHAGQVLPRRTCRPLDRCSRVRVSADLAAYDAAVECASIPDEEWCDAPPQVASGSAAADHDADFDASDDL